VPSVIFEVLLFYVFESSCLFSTGAQLAPQLLQCREVRLIGSPLCCLSGGNETAWERSVRELPVLNSRLGRGGAVLRRAVPCMLQNLAIDHGEARASHARSTAACPHSPTPTATEPATPADHTVPPATGPQSSAARAGRERESRRTYRTYSFAIPMRLRQPERQTAEAPGRRAAR
jgi:hypothetical protein